MPLFFSGLILICFSCNSQPQFSSRVLEVDTTIITGSQRMEEYLPLVAGKNVAVVANHSSLIGKTHLVDTLMALSVGVKKVFAPEHGFRGAVPAGEHISDSSDSLTGLPLISLYGKNKKPSAADLQGIDVVVFDIQDVGARFYTYLSTLHYVIEACAENNVSLILLDRPNPNGFYVDGPVLQSDFKSFVGMHPIPVVHGCTLGELARMIIGESWVQGKIKCDLTVIPCSNYSHNDLYRLPVNPSPNLSSMSSIYLYPSLCFFEGTIVSVGRGTEAPFTRIGYPGNTTGEFSFIPGDIPGVATNPPHEGAVCKGHDLRTFGEFYFTVSRKIYLEWLTGLYEACKDKSTFFTSPEFFDKLAGTDQLRKQVTEGWTADQITRSWESDLRVYRELRKKYLIYEDIE